MPSHTASRSILVAAILVAHAVAGPIDPPSGPITSTLKPLGEIEPRVAVNALNTPGDAAALFVIDEPGSYYLTGNIVGEAGKHGVHIATGGVTLDLMGFDLAGVPGSLCGVIGDNNATDSVAVVNGSVRGWGDSGIDLNLTHNIRIADIRASHNGGPGIYAGTNAVVTECNAFRNAGNGIQLVRNGSVMNCFSRENGAAGIVTLQGCVVWGCGAFQNAGDGIAVNLASIVSNCSSRQSGGFGITTEDSCTVSDCTVLFNSLDGIRVPNRCTVRDNQCDRNGHLPDDNAAAIHVVGSNNRLEANQCTGSDRGIEVDGVGNFIARNTCSLNATNWKVVAGNKCLVVLGVNAGAIVGDAGGVSPGSTDPNANFTY